jgi:hypothetical protein
VLKADFGLVLWRDSFHVEVAVALSPESIAILKQLGIKEKD